MNKNFLPERIASSLLFSSLLFSSRLLLGFEVFVTNYEAALHS